MNIIPIDRQAADDLVEEFCSPEAPAFLSEAWTLGELQKFAHAIAVTKGWWDSPRNSGELIALMHSELSEALEGLRKPSKDEHCPAFSSIAIEMADVVIRVMDFCEAASIDLQSAINAKMRYNATRPHKHGGKAF